MLAQVGDELAQQGRGGLIPVGTLLNFWHFCIAHEQDSSVPGAGGVIIAKQAKPFPWAVQVFT
jgi:hypothetical protein